MLHSLSEKIADFLLEKNDDYPLEVYTYGMELIISSLLEFIILLVVGSLLGKLVNTLIFVVSFSLIRFYTGGYHAKTYLRCGMTTILTFLSVIISTELLLLCTFTINIYVYFAVIILSLYIISKYAPIENENKELHDKYRLKTIAIIIYVSEVVIFLITYNLLNFNQALIFIPTSLSVDILMLVEIIKKRGEKNEKDNEKHIKKNVH